jgi:hypothetical protein
MTNYKKSLDNQIRLTDTLDPYYPRNDRDGNPISFYMRLEYN